MNSNDKTGVPLGSGIEWPLGQALPKFSEPAPILDAVRVETLDDWTFVTVLEGIVNREKPRVMVFRQDNEYDDWPDTLGLKLNLLPDKFDLVKKYRDAFEGLVVYEEFEPVDESLPEEERLRQRSHTVNLASTYAGIHDCLAVTGEMAEVLSKPPYSLPVREDYRGRFTGVSTKDDPRVNKREVYTYLAKALWPDCNKRLLGGFHPEAPVGIRDLAVSVRAAGMWLDPEYPGDKEIMDIIYPDVVHGETYHVGWWENEPQGVQYGTQYGVVTFASDFYNNMTVYGGQSRQLHPPAVPKKPKLQNKIYVALAVSDGDNLQYHQHTMRGKLWWSDPGRGTVPIAWTSSPAMLDAGPQILDYYYKTSTDGDYLIDGPSGLGYTVTDLWRSEQFDLPHYMQATNRYFELTGFNMATIWFKLEDFGPTVAENCPSALGFTLQDPEFHPETQPIAYCGENHMPFITLGNSLCYAMWPDLDRLTKGKIEEEAGKYTGEKPEFWMIQVCPWGTATLDRLNVIAEELRAAYPDTVEFVRADHLFMLRAEYDGEPFNVALRASAAASGYDGDATPDKAVDGSFAADKGWACSAEEKWLALDLGRTYRLSRYVIKHASTGYFPAEENARAWTFQVSDDGKSWQDADTVSGSADAISYRKLTKRVSARYIRLRITDPGASGTARIQELEVYGAVEK